MEGSFVLLLCGLPVLFGALLTTRQVAIILGISVRGVHSLIRRELLPAEKIGEGRDWYIQSEEVEKYQERRRKPGWQRKKKE